MEKLWSIYNIEFLKIYSTNSVKNSAIILIDSAPAARYAISRSILRRVNNKCWKAVGIINNCVIYLNELIIRRSDFPTNAFDSRTRKPREPDATCYSTEPMATSSSCSASCISDSGVYAVTQRTIKTRCNRFAIFSSIQKHIGEKMRVKRTRTGDRE